MENLTGKKFNHWTVLGFSHVDSNYVYYWECRCDCGTERKVRSNSLKSKNRTSCGCAKSDILSAKLTTHGMSNTPTYQSWEKMLNRCNNSNNNYYKNYGGRGIKVCSRWLNSFENFFKDMNIRPVGTTLDRIDVNKGYSKSNCRWATPYMQGNNTTRNVYYELGGWILTLSEWSRIMGIPRATIKNRIERRGDTFQRVADYFQSIGRWDGLINL